MKPFPYGGGVARRLPRRSGAGGVGRRMVGLFRDRKRRRTRCRSTSSTGSCSRATARRCSASPRRPAMWEKFLAPVPPRHHHGIFAMLYRVPEVSDQRRNGGVHAARASGAPRAGNRQMAGVGQCRAGAGLAGAARRHASGSRGDRRLCAGHRRRHDVSDLLRNRRHRAATCCACTPPAPTAGNSTG